MNRYIEIDRNNEGFGSSFALPHRTTAGLIGRNEPAEVLRHKRRLIPCERVIVHDEAEAGVVITETGSDVVFTVSEDEAYTYPGLTAIERIYQPPPPSLEQRLEPVQDKLNYLLNKLSELGIKSIPENWQDTIAQGRALGMTADDGLELYILWKEHLQPIEDDVRAYVAQLQEA